MKSFREYRRAADTELTEQIVSKTYAITQNAAFNTTKQKLNSVSSNLHSLAQSIKNTDDQNRKVDLLADALDQINRMLVLQSDLLLSVKNVGVASVLFADDIKTLLRAEMEKHRRAR